MKEEILRYYVTGMSMISSPLPSPPSLCYVQEELAQTEERLQSKRSQLEDLVVQVCDVCLSLPVCLLWYCTNYISI